ncbi:putative nucleotidyltransferase [Geoglobus ahangari]|uniref:protein adenylyltransferase n=1 Tax=Geoglobus ahangari TaxID=113653 RepID=A0A0F7IGZ5_9EURY|nr:nucleotidyltransferase domain-containing protein [Geoglobus ahangari]AKG92572.1 putative nucleotidyltransferase [Geoglobus ahangari]
MRGKTATFGSRRKVRYGEDRWRLLREKRRVAREIMETLESSGIPSIVYGSVARGDVRKTSDVDIFIPLNIPSYKIELALEDFYILERRIVQATPNYAIKGEIVLENASVSFPLVKMKEKEMDFYRFGGYLDLDMLLSEKRVSGVDKRLVLIVPLRDGHYEIPADEMDKSELADFLGVGIEIVIERFRVLERRREVGRTGVFLNEPVPDFESFESHLSALALQNAYLKRRMKLF